MSGGRKVRRRRWRGWLRTRILCELKIKLLLWYCWLILCHAHNIAQGYCTGCAKIPYKSVQIYHIPLPGVSHKNDLSLHQKWELDKNRSRQIPPSDYMKQANKMNGFIFNCGFYISYPSLVKYKLWPLRFHYREEASLINTGLCST